MAFHLSFSVGEIEINLDSDIDPTPDVLDMFMRQMKQQALNAYVTMSMIMGEIESVTPESIDKIMNNPVNDNPASTATLDDMLGDH